MITCTDELKIELIDQCADDLGVVNAARVSLDKESMWEAVERTEQHPTDGWWERRLKLDDQKLINFLMRERHGTPFEHGFFKFRVEAPIFVFREWHRHRVGHSYNEMSGRYTELEPKFFVPTRARTQQGKPGAYTYQEMEEKFTDALHRGLKRNYTDAWEMYQALLERGVAKEQARIVLPVAVFSKMIWSCNPRSLMHFLALRSAPNAMQEIRNLATQAEIVFGEEMPITYAAWHANGRRAP